MLRVLHLLVACCLALAPAGAAGAAPAASPDRPTRVILLIADGCGPASMTLARLVGQRPLALDGILVGAATTGSATSHITDSAAGATALASGVKTGNHMLGVDTTGRRVTTLLEEAEAGGLATGLVAKSTITDATPGAFAAHVMNRGSEDSVAVQELERGVDVLLGGGRRWFLPASAGGARKDGVDLVRRARSRGYACVQTGGELARVERAPVLGLFAMDDMSFVLDRDGTAEPSLPEMTRKAIALLRGNPRGFFLVVEGSRIDHAAHANDPAAHVQELLEYDEAARAVLDFARRDGRTLVVATADHETGGLSLGRRIGEQSVYELRPEALRAVTASAARMADLIRAGRPTRDVLGRYGGAAPTEEELGLVNAAVSANRGIATAIGEVESRRALVAWSTGGHTAADVGLHAFGPGSTRFRGVHDNTDVARIIAELMGWRLSPQAAQAPAGAAAGSLR